MWRSISNITLRNISNLFLTLHDLAKGTPYLDDVVGPIVPDIHASTAPGSPDKVASILADNLLNVRFSFLGYLEMPIMGLAQGWVVHFGSTVFHNEGVW